jgi:hypothetical protein
MSVFTFPRGPGAGNFLHGLLEALILPPCPERRGGRLVPDRLRTAGINDRWAPVVGTWMEHIVETNLMQGSDLCLKLLSRRDRLTEMGFYFPLDNLEVSAFNAILAEYGIEPVEPSSGLLNGLMTGYIDLVFRADGRFYITDYKSNHLGPDYPAYRPRISAGSNACPPLRPAVPDLYGCPAPVSRQPDARVRLRSISGGCSTCFFAACTRTWGQTAGSGMSGRIPGWSNGLTDCFGREVRD